MNGFTNNPKVSSLVTTSQAKNQMKTSPKFIVLTTSSRYSATILLKVSEIMLIPWSKDFAKLEEQPLFKGHLLS